MVTLQLTDSMSARKIIENICARVRECNTFAKFLLLRIRSAFDGINFAMSKTIYDKAFQMLSISSASLSLYP